MKLKRLLATLLTFALLAYLCACDGSSTLECRNCGGEYKIGALYCPSCGEKLSASVECSKGHENAEGTKFCAECGEALGASDNNNDNDDGNDDNNAPAVSVKCSNGHENAEGVKFCAECGEALGASDNNNNDDDNGNDDNGVEDLPADGETPADDETYADEDPPVDNGDNVNGGTTNGVKCEWCSYGRYTCTGCHGEGRVPTGYDVPSTKMCVVCHGEGSLVCSHCGGDGIFGN